LQAIFKGIQPVKLNFMKLGGPDFFTCGEHQSVLLAWFDSMAMYERKIPWRIALAAYN